MSKSVRLPDWISRDPLYSRWRSMHQRCYNPGCDAYPYYGGRGITVCGRWFTFSLFCMDMGELPSPEHEIDRFPDRHGNYEPGNVRWVLDPEQRQNQDRSLWVTYEGGRIPMAEAIRRSGLNRRAVYSRRARGWPVERWFLPIPGA